MNAKLTSRYATIATVGFRNSVASGINENRAAHGGVCHLQARRDGSRILGRKVNSNGRHVEMGAAWELTADELSHWQSMS